MNRYFLVVIICLIATLAKAQIAPQDTTVYTAVEKNAEFPKGIDRFYRFFWHAFRYPEKPRVENIQGTAQVSLVIEKDGSLSNIKFVKGISPGLDAEILRVIKLSPKWQPALQNGVPVRQLYTILLRSPCPEPEQNLKTI